MIKRTWIKCIPRALPLGLAAWFCCQAPAVASAARWNAVEIDNAAAVGQFASMVLDSNQKAHVSYYDTAGKVKYATDKSGSWVISTPVSAGVSAAGTSIAVSVIGTNIYPQINYYSSPSGNRGIRNIAYNGTAWATATNPDSNSFAPTLGSSTTVYNYNGYSYVLYSNNSGNLYYTRNQTQNSYTDWNSRSTVDSSGSIINSSLVVNKTTLKAYAVGYSSSNFDLFYYTNESGNWVKSTIQATTGTNSAGRWCSLTIDASGNLHLSYLETTSSPATYRIKYRFKPATTGSSFGAPVDIGDAGSAGGYSSIAVDSTGVPHISYYFNNGSAAGSLFYTNKLGGAWNTPEAVETTSSDVGNYSSIAVDTSQNVRIVYYDATNTALRTASKVPLDVGSALTFGTVDRGFQSAPASITVTNNLLVSQLIGTVALGGSNPADFSSVSDSCSGVNLNAGATCTISYDFAPPAGDPRSSARSASVTIPATSPYTLSPQVSFSGSTSANFLVTASAGNGGNITPTKVAVSPNGSQLFNVIPDAGFSVATVIVDGTTPLAAPYTLTNVTADHALVASLVSPIFMTTDSHYYGSLQSAYGAANDGWSVEAQTSIPAGDLTLGKDIVFNLLGGFDSSFTTHNGLTPLTGTVTINSGTLAVENLLIQ